MLKRRPSRRLLRPFLELQSIPKLAISCRRLLTAEAACRLQTLLPVEWLYLWSNVTRGAMRHIARIEGLRRLDVMHLVGSACMSGFAEARALEDVRAGYLTDRDIHALAECVALRSLSLQCAQLTTGGLGVLLRLPWLVALDLERTPFDDAMAEQMAASGHIEHLELGATRLNITGLRALQRMPRLRSLDLWATCLDERDLECLPEFPALEYVSLGGFDDAPSLDAARLLPILLEMPRLQRLWLDGVRLNVDQKAALEAKLDWVCCN